VPQEINLADTTVARNIAYGEPEEDIDLEAVRRAARSSSIHAFVQEELSEGYDTVVGEEGVRLSGGQRQRIGIARALYRDPEMLIFDEATSSVDTATERRIMESIYQLSGDKTILVIAHRTKTLERCDKILEIEEGRLVGERQYQEIVGA
jgi:ATP-binding cassette subfamily C protein